MKPLRNGKDLTGKSRDLLCIDLFGFDHDQARARFPATFQRLLDQVKPERDVCERQSYRDRWWIFAEPRPDLRRAIAEIPRYIATPMTAKHRMFVMLDANVLPDQGIVAIAASDELLFGVLSSEVHVAWSSVAGGTLEDRPRYNQTRCFETFPFPSEDTGLTPAIAERIRHLAEQLDTHRKARQAAHEEVTLTSMYNVLDKVRRGKALTAKERKQHEQALVSVLRSLHDDLDAAVLEAYGWSDLCSVPWADDEARGAWAESLLERLLALNAKRASEEAAGMVRWLRPSFQQAATPAQQAEIEIESEDAEAAPAADPAAPSARRPWPGALPDQIKSVADLLSGSSQPMSLDVIAGHFTARGRWRERLPTILETLAALGRIRKTEGEHWDGRQA